MTNLNQAIRDALSMVEEEVSNETLWVTLANGFEADGYMDYDEQNVYDMENER